jgi:hypothetical protein
MTVRERLVIGARLLVSIDAARIKRKAPNLFSAVEHEIIGRELDELESEWRENPGTPAVAAGDPNRRTRR